MKSAPNVKHLPKDKGAEAVIFAGSKAWEMAKAYQVKNSNGDTVPPIVLDHQQLVELENLNIIDRGRMFARVYQAGIIDQARISQILQKLAKAKIKQAQLYNEAGELVEDWTPRLQDIGANPMPFIQVHGSAATPALNQMGASQRGEVLLAHYGGDLAIHGDSDTVHHYNGVIWEPITDKDLQREMASIFNDAEIAYSQSGVKSTVETMKLSLTQMGTASLFITSLAIP